VLIYSSPYHGTWLALVALVLSTGLFPSRDSDLRESKVIEWSFSEVLDIGLPTLNALAPRDKAVAGLLQSFTVRTSGLPPSSSLH